MKKYRCYMLAGFLIVMTCCVYHLESKARDERFDSAEPECLKAELKQRESEGLPEDSAGVKPEEELKNIATNKNNGTRNSISENLSASSNIIFENEILRIPIVYRTESVANRESLNEKTPEKEPAGEVEESDEITKDEALKDETLKDETSKDETSKDEATKDEVTKEEVVIKDDFTNEIPAENSPDREEMEETNDVKQGFVINDSGMLEHFYAGDESVSDGYLEIPREGCVGISKGAFATCSVYLCELYIPSNISVIEPGAFYGLEDVEWLEIEAGNSGCQSMDGVIFDSGQQTLVAFPSARTGGYRMPVSVTYVQEAAFYNTRLSQLDLLNMNYVTFGPEVFGENGGAGLTIRVPMELEEQYRADLEAYQVKIEGVAR